MPPRSYFNEPRRSDYLAYASAYFPEEAFQAIAFFDQFGVPYVNNVDHLAAYVGVSSSLIRQILHKRSYHYRVFSIPKGNGDQRIILSPKTYLKVIQWWLCDNVLESAKLSDCVHGFRRGRSYITNAAAHLGANHLLNVDLRRFFPSITKDMIIHVFRRIGYSDEAALLLAELSSLNNEAPTGAPTSPAIGNIVLHEFDARLEDFAISRGLTYTRYADDITLSSAARIESEVLSMVSSLANEFGFTLNGSKTRFMGRGDRMEVTGIVINDGLRIPREWRNSARGYLHRVLTTPALYLNERHKIYGICGALKAVDPESVQSITKLADRVLGTLKTGVSL